MKLKKSVLMLSALLLVVGLQCVNAYDRDQIREKLLAIGMPESEITDSVLTKYVDFTNASLENEAKFDNEILAQLQKDNSAKWEEMKQQALKAQQEAEKKKAEEAASAAERQWKAINSPQNLANPDFTEVAKKMFDAYQEAKQELKKQDPSTYTQMTFLPIDDEKYLLINRQKVQERVFSCIDLLKISGFYMYISTVYNDDWRNRLTNEFWSKNSLTKPLVDAVIAKKKKNVQENIDNIKNALAQLYTDYGNYVKNLYQLKEKGNEVMLTMNDGDKINVLFKDGKFVRADVPADALNRFPVPSNLKWLFYNGDRAYDAMSDSKYGIIIGQQLLSGKNYGFVDFNWSLYVNQYFCKLFKKMTEYHGDDYSASFDDLTFCWLVGLKNLSVPEKIEGDPYSNLKFLDADGKMHTNLIYKDYCQFAKGLYGEGYTTNEIIAQNKKDELAEAKEEKAKKQAAYSELFARCKASNYLEMSIYNIVGLIEEKYIVKSYKSGATYMDVTNKWGAKRRLHIVDGYVVDQYILR